MVVEAAGQDARAVGDVAHGGRAQATFGEHGRGERKQLVSPAVSLTGHSIHPIRVSTKRLLGQLQRPGATGDTGATISGFFNIGVTGPLEASPSGVVGGFNSGLLNIGTGIAGLFTLARL